MKAKTIKQNGIFLINETDDKKYFISVGNNILTEMYDKKEELEKLIKNKDWQLIINVCQMLINLNNKEDKK